MSRYTEHGDIDRQYVANPSSPTYDPAIDKNEKHNGFYRGADDVGVAGGEEVLPREEETHRALKPRQVGEACTQACSC